MKDIDDLKKEIAQVAEREDDPGRKEKARLDKVKALAQEIDYHIARGIKGKNWLHENYPNAFHRDPWTPPKWLQRGKLGRILGRTRFSEVYAELARQALPLNPANRELTRKLGGYAWRGRLPEGEIKLPDGTVQPAEKRRMDVVVIPDVAEMAEKLMMSERVVRLYILEMVRVGILQELPKKLDRGQRGFKIGVWTYYWSEKTNSFEAKRIWLLKSTDKKMRAKFLSFKVRGD